ncbi:GTP pyrophosphokinase [Streptomyces sp. NPDC054797]
MSDKGADYEEIAEPLRNFAPALESLMRELLLSQSIPFHYVRSRVKTKVSTIRKLEKPSKSYTGISDLTDMLGVRIVTYFPDDVDKVASMIGKEFSIDEENSVDKRALLDADRFGYLSLHFIAQLGGNRRELAEYKRFGECKFEIQVRSILQHAWAEIEHDLGYKTSSDVPAEVRRRFSRVAGLLEVADHEFQEIRSYLERHQRELEAADRRNWRNVGIDQDSVYAFMRRDMVARSLDRRIAKAVGRSLTRPDRTYAATRQRELKNAGFSALIDVKKEIEEHREEIVKFAQAWISDDKVIGLFPKGEDFPDAEEIQELSDLDDEGDDFEVLPSGIGLFYLWLYKCARGEVEDIYYHEKSMGHLRRVYQEMHTS